MATADRTKVSLRGQQTTPLTRTQADDNFDELRKVIDDTVNLETKFEDLETSVSDVISAIQEDIDGITQATNINSIKVGAIEGAMGSMGQRDVTISMDNPSGGTDGDIWIKV